ncbi:MAG: hypothetical protein H6625_07905 [Bdellovibrionaceae bacterium]|nr:hypothetical protein [Pseudobdellovibrionaceae bacterium]
MGRKHFVFMWIAIFFFCITYLFETASYATRTQRNASAHQVASNQVASNQVASNQVVPKQRVASLRVAKLREARQREANQKIFSDQEIGEIGTDRRTSTTDPRFKFANRNKKSHSELTQVASNQREARQRKAREREAQREARQREARQREARQREARQKIFSDQEVGEIGTDRRSYADPRSSIDRRASTPEPFSFASITKNANLKSLTNVERYLVEILAVDDLNKHVLSKNLKEQLMLAAEYKADLEQEPSSEPQASEPQAKLAVGPAFDSEGKITEKGSQLLQSKFSEHSKIVLKKLFKSLGRTSYANSMLVGPAGAGKSFAINQLVAILSFGVVPEFLNEFLKSPEPSPFIDLLKQSFFGKTQFIQIDNDLLSKDNTKSGKAFPKDELRVSSLLSELFGHAVNDFKEKGIRTVFILEEVATLPQLVQQKLKILLDKSGFKTASKNPIDKASEVGYSVIGITTPGEYRDMVGNDSAVERRYEYVYILEPTETEALDILINKKKEWFGRYNLVVEDEVLAYMISMRTFFSNPPLAMPDSVLKVMDGLFLWATERHNLTKEGEITVEDAYRYLIEQSHLPKSTWIPQEEGRPPLWDLEERVQSHVIGHKKEINQIVRKIKSGRTTGFSNLPVFIIMSPSGGGKDTLANAINLEMFGRKDSSLNFDVGGQSRGLSVLLEGTDKELPKLITALNEGSPHGLIVLNEILDADTRGLDSLKVLIETGVIRPKGKDSRARPLGLNILFIMGQYGEELLDGKSDEQIEEIVNNLSEQDLENMLMAGRDKGTKGAIPLALIQRAIKSGGLFFLKPTPTNKYIDILKLNLKGILQELKVKSQLNLIVDDSVLTFASDLAILNKRGTRGLDDLLNTFTKNVISVANDQGLPLRGITIKISVDLPIEKIILDHMDGDRVVKQYHFFPEDLLTSRCETFLNK